MGVFATVLLKQDGKANTIKPCCESGDLPATETLQKPSREGGALITPGSGSGACQSLFHAFLILCRPQLSSWSMMTPCGALPVYLHDSLMF